MYAFEMRDRVKIDIENRNYTVVVVVRNKKYDYKCVCIGRVFFLFGHAVESGLLLT